ncbi:flagellar basal body L-ring protein FlgH [Aeromonas sp. sif2416]|uniref:flagellar basal body L-ring protein FlgH n=1 Tax=Aeromonas sp. sif2416 TaxID=2854793 RepID=UPI001C443F2A|nr:flagellar basal body L-ring protein FlgH [Aeromonas sp. sif2416]MBV7438436.1 flagellar basal body L-ring protein FlgH [Aeromonas sp. sif2416]
MKALWLLSLLSLAGCTSTPNTAKPDDPEFAPVYGESEPVSVRPTGAIFQPEQVNGIYSDIKAHKVGDIINIELSESTSASKKANTQSGKDNNFDLEAVTLGGVPVTASPYNLSASIDQSSAFKGQAKADQSNSLQGSISVSVVKVLPNGNLLVRGEKWIMLNNGNEYIRITGLVRPGDVSSENSVSSQKVANARIHYGGTGDLANTQEQGWLTSFFNGPWWPI